MEKKKEKRGKKSAFLKFWRNDPLARVLDFFLDNYLFDYSKSQVAEAIGMSRVTVHKVIDHLRESGVLKLNRKVGKSKMYVLNKDNPIVEDLVKLEDSILKEKEKSLGKLQRSRST